MLERNTQIEEVFSAAWQKVVAGRSIESVLSEYPQYAAALEPLLRTAEGVRAAQHPRLSPDALARIHERTRAGASARAQAREKAEQQRGNTPIPFPRPPSQRVTRLPNFSWLLPRTATARAAVLLLLLVAVGLVAAVVAITRQGGGPTTQLETYSGVITKISATDLWLGDTQILIDNATVIHGKPELGAEMVCIGQPLPGERMKALEVWVHNGPAPPTAAPTPEQGWVVDIKKTALSGLFDVRN